MSGELEWAVKASLLAYTAAQPDGTVATSGGARRSAGGGLTFPFVGGGDGASTLRFGGSVHLVAHGGSMDITLGDPWIHRGEAPAVSAVCTTPGGPPSRITLAHLDLSPSPGTTAGTVRWQGTRVRLTSDGACVLGGLRYYEHQRVDDLTVVVPAASVPGAEEHAAPHPLPDQQKGPSMTEVPRRIVTGHDHAGRAVFIADGPTPKVWEAPDGGPVFELWSDTETLVGSPGSSDPVLGERPLAPPAGGSVLRVVDFAPRAPGQQVHVHRTPSLDYCYVVRGSVVAVLDDGDERTLSAGDVLVQRGTNHGWRNDSGAVCRVLFVLIDAAGRVHSPTAG